MLTTTLIVRLLSKRNVLLGWGEVPCEARGDGALWPLQPCEGVGDVDGEAALMLIHWPDINAQLRTDLRPFQPIRAGQPFVLAWTGPLLRIDNPQDHPPLPPVTVRRSVSVDVPTGNIGIKTT